MTPKQLARIDSELAELEGSPRGRKPADFVRLAVKLGRRKATRGKEPTYVSPSQPKLGTPLSIPHHSTLKPGTARSILNTLRSDVDIWTQHLDQGGREGSSDAEPDDDSED